MAPDTKNHMSNWEARYRETEVEQMPWYYPKLEPEVLSALNDLGLTSGRVLDLGTGPGTQAMALAKLGFEVTASDISETAIKKAAQKGEELNLAIDWRQDDIVHTGITGRYDLIFDRGCFHVLDPEDRQTYVANVERLLRPGGFLLLKTFSYREAGSEGPHRFRPEQLREYFSGAFEIIAVTETVFQGNRRPLPKALFAVMKKTAF